MRGQIAAGLERISSRLVNGRDKLAITATAARQNEKGTWRCDNEQVARSGCWTCRYARGELVAAADDVVRVSPNERHDVVRATQGRRAWSALPTT